MSEEKRKKSVIGEIAEMWEDLKEGWRELVAILSVVFGLWLVFVMLPLAALYFMGVLT